jgi:IstB-like ATP binding protein
LNLDEETVAKWARQKTYCQHLRAGRKSKLDPYKPIIQRWLEQHPYSAAQIFQRLRAEQAYNGGISILTDYVRRVRPMRAPDYLKVTCVKENCQPLAVESSANHWSHLDCLGRLLLGEVAARQQRTIARRIKAARFPVDKTLEGFRWDWPKKINRLQIQDLFRLSFIEQKANVIFPGLVGLGKTHLATALGYAACQHG